MPESRASFGRLLADIRACELCAAYLPHGPRPVLQAHPDARLLIVSQAPGRRVHESGIPFDDKSGEKLREWLGIDEPTFHDEKRVAIVPMAFCYPGKGTSGDLPPRRECAPRWHPSLLPRLRKIELTLAIGSYAIDALPGRRKRATLTETVRAWRDYLDTGVMPLPHPSPRNTAWFVYNPWFEREAVPVLRQRVSKTLAPAQRT
ncbi:MAG: uracil-DNA glycosylase family protein [Rhodanobacteraceae bacterium]